MNHWGEGNHQQPKPTGREMPAWLPGALFCAGLALIVVLAALFRWVL